MRTEVLEAYNLYKTYDGTTWALEDFSLVVRGGEKISILGRNGAGKTTFIRIAATQLKKTKGTVRVMGFDVDTDAKAIRKRIAVVPQESNPLMLCTPWEHVFYYLMIRGFSIQEARALATRYLRELELDGYSNVLASNLSGGLRRRILVAMALASEAELIFLDEPTIGLDPLGKQRVWKVIERAAREGRTVVLTTHDMEEAELLSDRVAIVDRGRVVTVGNLAEIKSLIRESIRVDLSGSMVDADEFVSLGRTIDLGSKLRIYTDENGAREVLELALKRGVRAEVSRVGLEDAFLLLIGREDEVI